MYPGREFLLNPEYFKGLSLGLRLYKEYMRESNKDALNQ